ncbi:hypothetical protein [Leifsonia shinshuensis]|uniref:arsenate reductase/protein-tyrosine-phosphatase family protein n=1 Tax=Leifsonia shinshuensis TaxID=150026 RepID=UPI002864778A|nr:hypothetical protein [Leifsonia shinshuensis]MDR6971747.1 protein-tyrosine-phosphatase [Leifsonia shinshuensis]
MSAHDPFRVLALCTGNICRSPAMEALLATELADDRRFRVESAGTEAMTGWSADPPMARLLEARGLDVRGHRARQADPPMLERADLILTATFAHREWVASAAPRAARRAFTLAEFAQLCGAAPGDTTPRELVAWAASHRPPRPLGRGRSTPRGGAEGDIVDPYGRSKAVFEQSLAQLTPLVETVAEALLSRV